MGLFDIFRGQKTNQPSEKPRPRPAILGAVESAGKETPSAFDNKNITYGGDLSTYDYDSILRDKQKNISSLYELSDYFTDADPLYRGIIKGVYVPFTLSTPYKLKGANEAIKQRYEDYYGRINLNDKMRSIFLQYYKYGNVFLYLMENGNLISLPVHKCRIGDMMANGEPIVEFDVSSLKNDSSGTGVKAKKDFIKDDDLKVKMTGFPKEIADAMNSGEQWVQLNPSNTFVLQDLKEEWQRYSVPMVAACLGAFSKKALLQNYEKLALNIGARSFLWVKYGSPNNEDPPPTREELIALEALFKKAASTGNATPLAVTNNWVDVKFLQADMKEFFQDDKYRDVNAEILSAGGVSGVIVSGRTDSGSTFASAQVSIQTAAMRIKHARENFCELMNRINYRLNGILPHSKVENIPEFTFMPVDLAGDSKFQEVCFKLWQQGVISNQTMLDFHGFDIEQEVERRKKEESDGTGEILMPRAINNNGGIQEQGNPDGKESAPGRPKKDGPVDESKSQSGKQAKPSNPEGSL